MVTLAIGASFNVGKTTVIEALQCLLRCLSGAEISAVRQTSEELTNIPNVVGAIDGTHIKIKMPTESGPDYFSRLQQHVVVVQAVADGETRFPDVAAGFPGSMQYSRVLRNSALYRQ